MEVVKEVEKNRRGKHQVIHWNQNKKFLERERREVTEGGSPQKRK